MVIGGYHKKGEYMRVPVWMNKTAKAYWKHYSKQIEITETNQDQVALLCSALSMYRSAQETLDKEGLISTTGAGGAKRHPAVDIQKQAFSQIVRMVATLNLTKTIDTVIDDELDDLLKG